MKKEPHELVFHPGGEGKAPTWDCVSCGETVHDQVNGGGIACLVKAQEEHVCPRDLAKKRLKDDVARIEELLDELGVSIQIYEDSYYSGSAELMIVDNKTRVEHLLGTEGLG